LKKPNPRRVLLKQHPELHAVNVVCASCGASFSLHSTATALSVDVCSNCHPAYTGVERAAFSGNRVERFNRRLARAAAS
jgi:large subunit ribosomal protein L31